MSLILLPSQPSEHAVEGPESPPTPGWAHGCCTGQVSTVQTQASAGQQPTAAHGGDLARPLVAPAYLQDQLRQAFNLAGSLP